MWSIGITVITAIFIIRRLCCTSQTITTTTLTSTITITTNWDGRWCNNLLPPNDAGRFILIHLLNTNTTIAITALWMLLCKCCHCCWHNRFEISKRCCIKTSRTVWTMQVCFYGTSFQRGSVIFGDVFWVRRRGWKNLLNWYHPFGYHRVSS